MSTDSTQRKRYLDSTGGIMLLHMILYHICQWSGTMDHYKCIGYFFAYFMPWFFFMTVLSIVYFLDVVRQTILALFDLYEMKNEASYYLKKK